MKTMKTNTVQLIIAGIVVVLVAVCATFAWYAVGSFSKVSHITANMESPSTEAGIESGISEIQIYDPENSRWNTYDGEIPLSFVPGQSYSFKVLFKADIVQTAFLRLTGFEETALLDLLQYRVKFTESSEENYKGFTVNTQGEKPYAELLQKPVSELQDQGNSTYVVYYDLILPGEVESEGFDLSFHAIVELIFA